MTMKRTSRRKIAISLSALVAATPVGARTLYANASEIDAVFAQAVGGDTIKLEGSFGLTYLKNKTSSTAIIVDASQATFTDTLSIQNVTGLKLVGGSYDISAVTGSYRKAILVNNGDNIWFNKSKVTGVKGQQGISINDTTGVKVTNGTFTGLGVGVGLSRVTGGTLTSNKVVNSTSDGIDIADSHMIDASKNSCTGTNPGPTTHPDCIQIWSVKDQPLVSDISLTYNTASGATQGFTLFDYGGYRITMSNNTVNTSYSQGIACYGCIDSVITYNKVSTLPGSKYRTNINIIGGSNNTVANNTIGPKPAAASAEVSLLARSSSLAAAEITAVPEPGVWAMLIGGFGLVGFVMRRRPRGVAFA